MGLNYHRLFQYIKDIGLSHYYHVEVDNGIVSTKEHHVLL